ncbi:hypothetical protein SSX86_016753 [Deinandra increscens subsp. villosa]|uniref:non-specific serine/threonine protein kinase n=1 Tax=Deinandra increscens subsp. villosa TaxID=3103831 RepID=A0AAP0H0E1_9ASTR
MNSKQRISSSSRIELLFYALLMFLSSSNSSSFDGANGNGNGNDTDHHALLKIKSMITQDPYGALTSWNNSLHFCEWSGVTCGKRHRRVISIALDSQGLQGSLSPHVGNLSFLRFLSLDNNSFQGAIPHELGLLSRLRILSLSKNKFKGVIPTNISGCSNLEGFKLSHNKLVGSIPREISFLTKLIFLSLDGNNLTHGIPPILGNITSIEEFSINNNPLGGSIPHSLRHWNKLKRISWRNCNLFGTIPHSLYNLSLLTHIWFPENKLNGSLPPSIRLPRLVSFRLWGNQLTGPLPPVISNFSRLTELDMAENKFSGKLTIDFARLRDIEWLSLDKNNFGSRKADEMNFIDSLNNSTKLEFLSLHDCKFQGVLPISIGNLSNKLYRLYLGWNQLHGKLPISLGNLVGLSLLSLRGNQFTGNIPSTIGNLQKLQFIDLRKNQLSGPIPDAIGNLSMLFYLNLYSNKLEGDIPSSLGNCHQLITLYLHDNKFSGKIPTKVLQLSSISIRLDLSQNNLFGSLPSEVGDLKMLNDLDLSYNNLSGTIPTSLGGCVGLSNLYLKGNLFQGMIPSSLSFLKGLVELDVSQNNLSGQIPRFLEGFPLEYLNLSYNDFEGEVPMINVFANASAFSVLGNSRLCGGIVELGLPKCNEISKHKNKFPLFAIVILIASVLFTITYLAYVLLKKKKRKSQPSLSSMGEQFMTVSYNQLLKATNGFSEASLIGNGGFSSVYKGILDGNFVAVKVLHLQIQGAQRSFMRECEAWRNIRHRNLLKIITSCSSVDFQGNDFKALVYEFIPNGSLHDWLHSSESTSRTRLNLLQIINILMDVAYALDYIHNNCLPNIIHGDLKPRNILLDNDMVAHVGDFGLVHFLGTSYAESSIGIKGTIGYVAPEYGLGNEMTSIADVYSFGIILLEMVTGKMPIDDMFSEGFSLHKYASMALPNHVMDVIDVNILEVYQGMSGFNREAKAKKIEECLALMVNIGVSCSVDFPSQRMDIKKVVHELRHILDTLQNIEV